MDENENWATSLNELEFQENIDTRNLIIKLFKYA